ncbi:hypothetical protein CP981_12760 [Streptomyces platensis]|uniref:Uncharacterized protein n=1 Tax=Streptomyces platensis TaxID=58346 RepID=A0AAE6NG94_STRPT|nr:hypothetical protein CP981_12760 [Streptomyces platensis]
MTEQSDSPEFRNAVPTTVDEAPATAHAAFRPRCHDGTLASVRVQEFDSGSLFYATLPPTEPRSFGGSHLVISTTDGALPSSPASPRIHRSPATASAAASSLELSLPPCIRWPRPAWRSARGAQRMRPPSRPAHPGPSRRAAHVNSSASRSISKPSAHPPVR